MLDQLKKDADEALQHHKERAEKHPCPVERKRAKTRVQILEDGKREIVKNYDDKGNRLKGK